jgi:hypothetical protein
MHTNSRGMAEIAAWIDETLRNDRFLGLEPEPSRAAASVQD